MTSFFHLFSSNDVDVIVKVRLRGVLQIIEVTVPTKLFTIRAEESHEDLYAAIDLVQKKLETQIKKNKSKIASRYKDKKGYVIIDEEPVENEEVEESLIVRRKEVEFKPMDEEEAILQMELTNTPRRRTLTITSTSLESLKYLPNLDSFSSTYSLIDSVILTSNQWMKKKQFFKWN